jgi:tRNA wybutosine-synthesizing protein 1
MVLKEQITPEMRIDLSKQHYKLVGNHSSVKTCGWTIKHLHGEGVCYKCSFYGIRSHQCLQMTCAMYCASRCIFCWRGDKAPVSKKWYGPVDEPKFIVDESLKQQKLLLTGYRANPRVSSVLSEEMMQVRHVALSLTGEPIVYPKINDLLCEFHSRKISTFLVTNAQYPDEIASIKYVTQLYLSIDAPNKELFKKVDRPLFIDYNERMEKSLVALSKKKFRTCIRLTLIRGINDSNHAEYAKLIKKGKPSFVEVKAYMHVGASRENLKLSNMPLIDEIMVFSKELAKYLPDYEVVASHKLSRVVLLKKKGIKQYINFRKFFDIANNKKSIYVNSYGSNRMCRND